MCSFGFYIAIYFGAFDEVNLRHMYIRHSVKHQMGKSANVCAQHNEGVFRIDCVRRLYPMLFRNFFAIHYIRGTGGTYLFRMHTETHTHMYTSSPIDAGGHAIIIYIRCAEAKFYVIFIRICEIIFCLVFAVYSGGPKTTGFVILRIFLIIKIKSSLNL